MAENTTNTSGKGFGKIFQKSVTRTKAKVLQNLGKADKTRDDDFEQHVQNFNDQQATVEKLQKELKHYTACIRDMSVASYNMYRTVKETYEINWTGYTEITSAVEQMSTLWEDYMLKLTEQVTNPLMNYINSFQDVKKLIAKRGRKLTDYDSARHNHESLCTAKRHDEARITKALDELNEARQVYENINVKLNEELPEFHEGRIGFIGSLFNAMFTAENVFQHESAKLKDVMSDVTLRLSEESNRGGLGLRKFSVPLSRSDSDVDNQKSSNNQKLENNFKNPVSKRESTNVTKPVPSARSLSTYGDSTGPTRHNSAASPVKELEKSPLHGNSQWYHEPESSDSSPKMADGEHEKSNVRSSTAVAASAASAASAAAGVNGHYSLPKPVEEIYKVPTSNQLITSPSPDQQVLYKVIATHSYVGDDTDELSFEPGEVILVVPFNDPDDQDEGWLTGVKESTEERGVFPENFTKRL